MLKLAVVILSVLLLTLIGCSGNTNSSQARATPMEVVEIFFDAYARGDGNTLVSCMCEEATAEVNAYILTLQQTAESSADYLNSIGIQASVEDIETLTAGNFVTLIFNSPAYSNELPDFSGAEFGEVRIVNNRAIVPVTIDNTTEPIELIIEDDEWKIVGSNMGIL